jgi:hypothetical protein
MRKKQKHELSPFAQKLLEKLTTLLIKEVTKFDKKAKKGKIK